MDEISNCIYCRFNKFLIEYFKGGKNNLVERVKNDIKTFNADFIEKYLQYNTILKNNINDEKLNEYKCALKFLEIYLKHYKLMIY